MPTYAYRCPNGHDFDVVQKISEPSGATCPRCGRPAQRVITGGAGIVFKGSGFYITDYKRKGKKPTEDKGSQAGESGAGGGKSPEAPSSDAGSQGSTKRDPGSSDA